MAQSARMITRYEARCCMRPHTVGAKNPQELQKQLHTLNAKSEFLDSLPAGRQAAGVYPALDAGWE